MSDLERGRTWADLPGADAWDAALAWADAADAWATVPPVRDPLADGDLDALDLERELADLERLGVRAGRLAALDLPLRALVALDLDP